MFTPDEFGTSFPKSEEKEASLVRRERPIIRVSYNNDSVNKTQFGRTMGKEMSKMC